MRVLVQRVSTASVSVDTVIQGKISNGLLLFIGVHHNDTAQTVKWCVNKILNLRIFSDDYSKMNLSLKDINGSVLAISQFTLYANTTKGRRPHFGEAASAQKGKELYELFIELLKKEILVVQTGVFQAHMEVTLCNDGPVTLMIEKEELTS